MSVKVIEKKDNKVVFEWQLPWDEFKQYEQKAYLKDRGHFRVDGFRKGKAPKHMIENYYGKGIFAEEAINMAINENYESVIKELDINAIGYPDIDIEKLEDGQAVVMKVETEVMPEIEFEEFKKLEIPLIEEEITDETVDAYLEDERNKNQREIIVDDRAAKEGDQVIIDFKGFLGDEPFEGGEGEDTELVLGSGQFIPGFEDQIVGKKIDEEFDVVVTFPENYHASELAGKEATFKTKLKGISEFELPELDDDFASEISEFDTLDEFKADIRKNLEEQLKEAIAIREENAAVDALVEKADFVVPEAIIHDQQHKELDEYKYRLQQQGLDFNMFLQYTGQKEEDIFNQLKEVAERRARANMTLAAYAKKLGYEVTDEDRETAIKEAAAGFGMEPDKFYEMAKSHDITFMDQGITNKKVVEHLMTIVDRVKVEEEKDEKKEKKAPKKATKKSEDKAEKKAEEKKEEKKAEKKSEKKDDDKKAKKDEDKKDKKEKKESKKAEDKEAKEEGDDK
ncbi:trigger factor [uncultured Ezakiella sp.]|uniref:trigger factor n=1 Tax=uncultured Ezakiella sp. TaxID=1637529 RepID=UPI0025CFDC90|nr:trigger factor [uncultured Ezakiella sp.]